MKTVSDPAVEMKSPTSVRWRILLLLFVISMVTYLDRVNVAIAASHIAEAHHLTPTEMGRVFSAFVLAYGLFQLPGGWLGDRFGPRIVLAGAMIWWSAFTAITALATRIAPLSLLPPVVALIISRFSLGMGEAAAWPNFNRTIANWMAPGERAFASSVPLAGGGLGAAVTPPLIAWMIIVYGWREAFFVCAGIGMAVALVWLWYARDRPEIHSGVNDSEQRIIGREGDGFVSNKTKLSATPWRAIVFDRNVWLLTLINFCCGFVAYIYLTWFYTYLLEVRGLSIVRGSYYTIGPFLAIALMAPLGGAICDYAAKRVGKRIGRKVVGMASMAFAGLALLLGAQIESIRIAIVFLSLGAGAVFVSFASQFVVTIDICRPHAGVVAGIMNWGGNTGGMISPMLMPVLAQHWGWTYGLQSAAILILAGSLLWWILDPERQVLPSPNKCLNEAR